MPGRQLGSTVAAELMAGMSGEWRGECALDARTGLVRELSEGGRSIPREWDAKPERYRTRRNIPWVGQHLIP
jgi:hypothetical protein